MAVQLRNNDGYTWHVQTKRNKIQKNNIGTLGSSSVHISYQFFFCFLKESSSSTIFFPALLFYRFFAAAQVCPRCHITSCQLHAGGFQRFLLFLHRKARCNDHDRQIEPARGATKNCPGQASFNVSLKSNGQNKKKKNPGS